MTAQAGLAPWLEPLVDAELMRAVDQWAVEQLRIPIATLMERAGEGLARVASEALPAGRLAVVCGKGNNGGDGIVAARLLREDGRSVDVILVWPDDGNAEVRAQLARLPGPPPRPWSHDCLERAAGVVDAVLGTGAHGALRAPVPDVVAAIRARGVPVVAADVPSGVDASTGEVAEAAVYATVTATFHAGKPGLYLVPGKEHAGRVEVVDLALPVGGPGPPAAGLIRADVLEAVPRRGTASTKFTSGHVLVIGGSRGLTGAPAMSAHAAMRTGAGYVTVALPATLEPRFRGPIEAMTIALGDDGDAALVPDAEEAALAAAARADAVVLGPGLGRAEGTQAFARTLATGIERPLLLDADGLNAFAGRLSELAARTAPTVLTPHPGELARLMNTDAAAIGRGRLVHAREAAATAQAVVVLKGDDTIVVAPDGRAAISPGGAPGLATAGTGDVLAGACGALLAKGMAPWHAACAAVYAHVIAGRIAAEAHGPDGVIATDVIAALPAAFGERSVG